MLVPQANSEWYGFYKKLRAALASLPAAGPGDAGNDVVALQDSTVSIQRDYDPSLALTPAASESLVTLIRATEQLLAAKESEPGVGAGGFDVTAAEACRKVRSITERQRTVAPVVKSFQQASSPAQFPGNRPSQLSSGMHMKKQFWRKRH